MTAVILLYVTVWLVYGWRLSLYLLDAQVRQSLDLYRDSLYSGPDGASKAAREWRGTYLVAGFGLALLWPVVAPARGVYRVVSDRGLGATRIEREYTRDNELAVLRKQARDLDLPMPEVKS